ncbi:hypothetical protein BHM03_00018478 [Ensete ventricosum]|nr:hypothetical protein BHM03_00018478 [Ensete ventricosum]
MVFLHSSDQWKLAAVTNDDILFGAIPAVSLLCLDLPYHFYSLQNLTKHNVPLVQPWCLHGTRTEVLCRLGHIIPIETYHDTPDRTPNANIKEHFGGNLRLQKHKSPDMDWRTFSSARGEVEKRAMGREEGEGNKPAGQERATADENFRESRKGRYGLKRGVRPKDLDPATIAGRTLTCEVEDTRELTLSNTRRRKKNWIVGESAYEEWEGSRH